MIEDIWIVDKYSGLCIIHKKYGKSQNIDSNLFSGLLTAIVNFSAEITGGDYIKAVTMGSKKFFYSISDYFILAVSMDLSFDEVDAKIFLGNILTAFVKLGYADKAINQSDYDPSVFKPFEISIDKIVKNTKRSLAISANDTESLTDQYPEIQEIESPEIKLKKAKIEEAIEHAEHSLSKGFYKDALIHFQTAKNLFNELEEFDMAKWCKEMIERIKMVELEEEIEAFSKLEREKAQKFPDETEKITKETPILVKKLGKKKMSFIDMEILSLCNGNRTIEEISNKTNIPLIKVKEIIQKYQKRNFIEIKRASK
ncbi:MAG: hypothetical protein ACFFCM_07725 [Promethearchaeota archaeon]